MTFDIENISPLAIGTVQFGLDYGISNSSGKISDKEARAIFDTASNNRINVIDTAKSYGNSEKNIGKNDLSKFKVITKLEKFVHYNRDIDDSLLKLKINKLYAVLIHDFDYFIKNETVYSDFKNDENLKVEKIGFSLNRISELEYLIQNKIKFDIVQVPYNLFDQRFGKYFNFLKEHNIEIHTRSVFLQGLFFLDKLPNNLSDLDESFSRLKEFSSSYNLQIENIALSFVLSNMYIDRIIIGVTNAVELQKNIDSISQKGKVNNIIKNYGIFANDNEDLVLPMNWK